MEATREELLSGLTYVKGMLGKMQEVLTKYINLERGFRAKQQEIGTSSVKDKSKLAALAISGTVAAFLLLIAFLTGNFFTIVLLAVSGAVIAVQKNKKTKLKYLALGLIAFTVLYTVYGLVTSMTPGLAILLLIFGSGIVAAEYFIITGKNRKIAAYNEEVEAYNQKVQEQRTALYNRYLALQKDLTAKTPRWFPPDYYNMEAVEFFLAAVRNSRADSVKEMVNLFESTAQHKEMIAYQQLQTQKLDQLIDGQQELVAGQKEANRQLRFANMMSVANFIQLSGINSGVRDLSAQTAKLQRGVDSVQRTADGVQRTAQGIASDVSSIKAKLNRRR